MDSKSSRASATAQEGVRFLIFAPVPYSASFSTVDLLHGSIRSEVVK
jgi:hypothetical protein